MMEMEKDLHVERKNTEKAFNEYLPKSILCHVKEKKVSIEIYMILYQIASKYLNDKYDE